ncbi:MAG: pyridoxamine kinase [Candidatus Faecousia sp.]|uniref:pyridoxamine kinase n=1 Tax=Faecousia sp. TaxID=2952921 RepID=UPI002A907F72|nr:pyridoxamine kinase [Candidatus Faecousia sp.]
MKRIASIQDFSCIGSCSQTIALPVLSAMGVECAALPTALLSAHTAFDGFVSLDLTPQLPAIMAHWRAMHLRFDAVYTGYLASAEQVGLVGALLDGMDERPALTLIDPVMGDNGALYAGFSDAFPQAMRALCGRADVLTPNVTEACLLTGTAYSPVQDAAQTRRLLERLLELGCRAAVLTGLRVDGDMAVAALQRDGTGTLVRTSYIPEVFHGTGDLFASTCAGALVQGAPLERAVRLAADYVALTLRRTVQAPDRRWYGVNFQETLPELMARWQNIKEELP